MSSRSKFTVTMYEYYRREPECFPATCLITCIRRPRHKANFRLVSKMNSDCGSADKHFMLQQAYQPGHPLLSSWTGQRNGCTDRRIIWMFTLPYSSIDMFLSACYFWPPGFISLAYGVFPPRCDWGNLMTYVYCHPKILTYLIFPVIPSFVLPASLFRPVFISPLSYSGPPRAGFGLCKRGFSPSLPPPPPPPTYRLKIFTL